jgi:hypothetical protein
MNVHNRALALADELEDSPDEVTNINAASTIRFLVSFNNQLMDEVARLNKALTWEQNRAERIGTHGPGCHTWGSQHYECLLRVNAELVEALKVFCSLGRADSSTDWNVAFNEGAKAIAKATGGTK